MPKYRVKSGVIYLHSSQVGKKSGRQIPARANDVVNITCETATKFKDQLLPIGPDAIFIDELDEYSELASREVNMRMVPIEGDRGFYNVQNTITGRYVNSAPLSAKEAMQLIKGTSVKPVFDEYEANNIKPDAEFDLEEAEEEVEEEEDVEKEEKPKKKKSSKSKSKSSKSKSKSKKKKIKE